MVLFETDHVFMMKTIQCWPIEQHNLLWDHVPYKLGLAVRVAACTSLSVTLHKSLLSFISVFPHLKAGAA